MNGSEWLKFGSFACKAGLITHMWVADSQYSYTNKDKARHFTVYAYVKNVGCPYMCKMFLCEVEANEYLRSCLCALGWSMEPEL